MKKIKKIYYYMLYVFFIMISIFNCKDVFAITGYYGLLDTSPGVVLSKPYPNIFDNNESTYQHFTSSSETLILSLNSTTRITSLSFKVTTNDSNAKIVFKNSSGIEVTPAQSLTSTSYFYGSIGTHDIATVYIVKPGTSTYLDLYDLDFNVVDNTMNLLSVTPANNSLDVGLNDDVLVKFDKNIKSGTGTYSIGGVSTTNTIVGDTLRMHPNSPFTYNTIYTVSVSGVQNVDGVSMSGSFTSKFTTIKDTVPVSILNILPPPNSTNNPLDTDVRIQFNKSNIDSNSLDNVYIVGLSDITKSLSNDTLTIKFNQPLDYSKTYTIHVEGVKDILGNTMSGPVDVSFSTVSDNSPLQLLSYKPPGGILPLDQVIEFNFNKNIDSSSIIFTLKDSDGKTVTCSKSVVGSKVTFLPLLQSGKSYKFTLVSCKDLNGNIFDSSVNIDFETMKTSGQQTFDDITAKNLMLFSDVKDNGFKMVGIAITIGILFIGSIWAWRKLNLWLKKS